MNDFVRDHRNMTRFDHDHIRSVFERVSAAFAAAPTYFVVRRSGGRLNAALLEAIYIGAMRAFDRGEELALGQVNAALSDLIRSDEMSASISGSTALEENVRTRLRLATEAFACAYVSL